METSVALLGLTVAEATARLEAASLPAPRLLRALPPRPPADPPPESLWRIVRVDDGSQEATWVITPPMATAPREDAACSG
ncbi:MAG: hypothetical protein VKS61_11905 [Candidatus Sericytochromatia bacterium]|nr:hypothetical protein [Candidatus Sericytochromatia bacterium]